ncbi:hypothetical protein XENORESO_004302, partial [Xenotaenia resolanae]
QSIPPAFQSTQSIICLTALLIDGAACSGLLRMARRRIEAYILVSEDQPDHPELAELCLEGDRIVNMSFPLSDQPVFGEWFVFVEVQGQTYNKSFEVQKYVMPKFELVIVPPPYIRDLSSCEQASVTA